MPRSRHADTFNHDEDAAGYDADVRNSDDPIRTGYDALLDWVAERASGHVLDLGTGTGNLLQRVRADRAVAVDVSTRMLALARAKRWLMPVDWREDDLLAYLDGLPDATFDSVISTYAIHHLTDDEKAALFAHAARVLRPGGQLAFGDLMFESAVARPVVLAGLAASGHTDAVEAADEEFFWDVSGTREQLAALGLAVEVQRFSLLSFGIAAHLPKAPPAG